MQRLFKLVTHMATAVALILMPQAAYSADILGKAIETVQPCKSLHVKQFGASVGIDRFKEAHIETLELSIAKDTANLSTTASLACQTSDNALLKGDVSATVHLDATLDLRGCEILSLDAKIIETGGTFKDLLDPFKEGIVTALKAAISKEIRKLCE